MSVIYRRMLADLEIVRYELAVSHSLSCPRESYRRRAPHILVALLVNEGLELLIRHLALVDEDMVVHRTSCALDGAVRTQVEIILEGRGDARLDESSRKAVAVLVSLPASVLRKESIVVPLPSGQRSCGKGKSDTENIPFRPRARQMGCRASGSRSA